MNKSFGELLGDSWNEYKLNFKVIFKLFLYFVIIPGIVLLIFNICTLYSTGMPDLSATEDFNSNNIFQSNQAYGATVGIISALILGFISFLAYLSMTCGALKGRKFSYSEALHEAKKNYWRAIGYTIVVAIFLALLFMLLIIPGIIFAVYWIFSYYVFLNEKKGIMESLKISHNLVKNKWWMTFGYGILIMLVMIGISFVISIPSIVASFVYVIGASQGFSISGFVLIQVVSFIFGTLSKLITTPLLILFMKNFYFAMSNKKQK